MDELDQTRWCIFVPILGVWKNVQKSSCLEVSIQNLKGGIAKHHTLSYPFFLQFMGASSNVHLYIGPKEVVSQIKQFQSLG